MIWLLLVVFFTTDGPHPQTKIEPTLQACENDISQIKQALMGERPQGLMGIGLKCEGPLIDPTIQQEKVGR